MAARVSNARKAGQSVGSVVGALAGLGLVGYFFVLPVVGSFVGFSMRMSYYENNCDTSACVRSGLGFKPADWREQMEASHKRSAPQLCPLYLNGSYYEQWVSFRELSWCEEYPQYANK